jgi:mRNA interferase RelE/StbE
MAKSANLWEGWGIHSNSLHIAIFSDKFMKTIVLSKDAERDFDALPMKAQKAIEEALIGYALNGKGDLIRMVGRPGFRMRVGHYRIILTEDGSTVLAIYIGRRNEATYRRH